MQTVKLNLIPGSVMPVVNVSQYDVKRQFALSVYEGAASYSLSGKSVEIRGTKPDGNGFAYDQTDGVVSVSGNTVTISTKEQMTAVGGHVMAELHITSGQTILGTLNFIIDVEPSALSDDTPISGTEIPAIERQLEEIVESLEVSAEDAEAWAVGERDGEPVPSSDPTYHNNAKYYASNALSSASTATTKAGEAATSATNAGNSATTASNAATTATTKAGEASTSATNAGNSATAAAGSATSAGTNSLKSEGFAVGEQNGTPVGPDSPYYQNNAAYYAAQARQYATGGLIFKGSVAFASIPTTGMVNGDMYNITDDFTTDSRFIEGAGVAVKAGADIAFVAGSVNKWDILALGGGSDDYSQLINKPRINNVELNGNKTPAELGLATDAAMTGASAGSAGAKGLVPAPAAGDQDKVLYGDGTWKTPTGGSDMTGATASTPGTHGLVPAPAAGDNTKFLRGDGTWAEAGGGGGFDYKDWLIAGDLNPMSYADLAAVLADEKAVRKLMTIHTAVDYLASQDLDADVLTILSDNLCAKWINLRDYALDTLYGNQVFAPTMDQLGKYGYGEWAKLSESPETWGPKGNVPIMTSNTAPYGECVGNTMASGYDLYKAFDGDPSTFCRLASETSMSVAYKFVNPTKVKKAYYFNGSSNAVSVDIWCGNEHYSTGAVQVSESVSIPANTGAYIDCNPDGYYFYYRAYVHSTSAQNLDCKTLQFYGRELKVSVPTMTSDTEPWGECFADISGPNNPAYYAFDNNDSTMWVGEYPAGTTAPFTGLGYDFGYKVVLKMAMMKLRSDQGSITYFRGSDDGTNWDDLSEQVTRSATGDAIIVDLSNNDKAYRYIELNYKINAASRNPNASMLQFYGLNYSEYDWDADTPRHYLYDHGIAFETITYGGDASYKVLAENDGEAIHLKTSGGAAHVNGVFAKIYNINLSAYSLFRLVTGNTLSCTIGNRCALLIVYLTGTSSYVAYSNIEKGGLYLPYNISLDASTLNSSYDVSILDSNNGAAESTFTEWWLE